VVKDRKKKGEVLVAPPPGYLERAVVVVREGGVGAVVGEKSAFHSHTYVHTHTTRITAHANRRGYCACIDNKKSAK
jgi:hypothetical protein